MQALVFKGDLEQHHIEGLKEFLRHECEAYTDDEAKSKGISFEAFKCLQKIFIKRMKLQTCWLILEHYGYNHCLKISEEYLIQEDIFKQAFHDKWESIECSKRTIDFLNRTFDQFSQNSQFLSLIHI